MKASALLATALLLNGCTLAFAHQAKPTAAMPQGWQYPADCCSNQDCKEMPATTIVETTEGFKVPSGETIPHGDKRIRYSPDGVFHWCAIPRGYRGDEGGGTQCLFVPPRSY